MTLIFHDYIHKILEDYINDILSKSLTKQNNVNILWKIFERMWKYYMILNPKNCVFCVDSGNILGFNVSHRGIDVDTKKIDAIFNMPPHRNISQLHTLQGIIQAIYHFVASLGDRMLPLHISLRNMCTFIGTRMVNRLLRFCRIIFLLHLFYNLLCKKNPSSFIPQH